MRPLVFFDVALQLEIWQPFPHCEEEEEEDEEEKGEEEEAEDVHIHKRVKT